MFQLLYIQSVRKYHVKTMHASKFKFSNSMQKFCVVGEKCNNNNIFVNDHTVKPFNFTACHLN